MVQSGEFGFLLIKKVKIKNEHFASNGIEREIGLQIDCTMYSVHCRVWVLLIGYSMFVITKKTTSDSELQSMNRPQTEWIEVFSLM